MRNLLRLLCSRITNFIFFKLWQEKRRRLREEFFLFYSRLQFLKLTLGLNRGMPK